MADALGALRAAWSGDSTIGVAFSGGRDSVALLHAAGHLARTKGGRVVALHVHHGLSVHADEWLSQASAQCRQWAGQGLPIEWRHARVAVSARGQSLEAAARRQRYAALAVLAREAGVGSVLLGHHRRDQAETFLLQALRGGGAAGLAAMPGRVRRDGIDWLRPWLHVPRESLEAYVAEHGLGFVDDDSNEDTRFARNRLRAAVLPALVASFPQAELALTQAAARAADVQACVEAWLDQLLPAITRPSPGGEGPALSLSPWAALPLPQRRESFRHWFRQLTGKRAATTLVERVCAEAPAIHGQRRAGRWVAGEVTLDLYRGLLTVRHSRGMAPVPMQEHQASEGQGGGDERLIIALPGWGGHLVAAPVSQGGLDVSLLAGLTGRWRQGGEDFQLGPTRPARALKKQYQALGVPVHLRHGPLVYAGDRLVFVPGLGIDARACALPGAPQVTLKWVPATTI